MGDFFEGSDASSEFLGWEISGLVVFLYLDKPKKQIKLHHWKPGGDKTTSNPPKKNLPQKMNSQNNSAPI